MSLRRTSPQFFRAGRWRGVWRGPGSPRPPSATATSARPSLPGSPLSSGYPSRPLPLPPLRGLATKAGWALKVPPGVPVQRRDGGRDGGHHEPAPGDGLRDAGGAGPRARPLHRLLPPPHLRHLWHLQTRRPGFLHRPKVMGHSLSPSRNLRHHVAHERPGLGHHRGLPRRLQERNRARQLNVPCAAPSLASYGVRREEGVQGRRVRRPLRLQGLRGDGHPPRSRDIRLHHAHDGAYHGTFILPLWPGCPPKEQVLYWRS